MAITDVLDKAVVGPSLKKLLSKYLTSTRENPHHTPDSYIRASGFAEMCPREEVLLYRLKRSKSEKISTDLELIFNHGTALHWALQNIILPKTGIILGTWKCLDCNKLYGAQEESRPFTDTIVPKPTKCDCGTNNFLYVEHHFKSSNYGIGGHPDGFGVMPGLDGVGILEYKSINGNGFWEIKDYPQVGHVIQIHVYFLLTGLKWAKILYWNKEGKGLSAICEHHVERDEEMMDQIKATLVDLKRGMVTDYMPGKICETNDCPRAKKCNAVKECFADEQAAITANP